MLTYIIRRLFLMIPTLIGVTAVVFFVMGLSPGGVGGSLLNEMGVMDSKQASALRDYYNKRYGLDKPLYMQYLNWLNRFPPLVTALNSTKKAFPNILILVLKSPTLAKVFPRAAR